MRRWFVVGSLVVAAAAAGAGFVACTNNDSSAAPSDDAGSCVALEASVSTQITSAGAGFCATCLQTTCATAVANCAGDCTCNGEAVQALACLAGLGASGSSAAENDCLEPLSGSSDGFASYLASCVLSCAGACEDGGPVDAGCGSADASLTGLLVSGSTGCEDCLQASCRTQASACAQDCACNAEAVTAVECLANLAGNPLGAPSVAAANACVAPVASAQPDSGLGELGGCLYASCSLACGLTTADAGEPSEAGTDAGTDASDAAVTEDAGADAGNDAGYDAGFDAGFDGGDVICGGNNQACCAGDSCNPGYHCVGSTCVGD
jgi:hypothetical protein